MRLIESLKKRKLILLNVFLFLYVGINLIGGERGLIKYFEKQMTYKGLVKDEILVEKELTKLKHNIKLIMKNDLDYLDILFREKFIYGAKDEIIIKIK